MFFFNLFRKKPIGIARTVFLRGDFFPILKAIEDAQPGEVIVIDPNIDWGQSKFPVTGGIFSLFFFCGKPLICTTK